MPRDRSPFAVRRSRSPDTRTSTRTGTGTVRDVDRLAPINRPLGYRAQPIGRPEDTHPHAEPGGK
ncbi:hypothetical protein ABZV75_39465 [Streptomyces flaveolus]|uniref:hypothetical protein n=1 Tax=Streptomyces flaveolus TaxID=67297 RepID=UPI0033A8D2E2